MSKQDFVALADAIKEHNASPIRGEVPFTVEHLVTLQSFCQSRNAAFLTGRWRDYIAGKCGPKLPKHVRRA